MAVGGVAGLVRDWFNGALWQSYTKHENRSGRVIEKIGTNHFGGDIVNIERPLYYEILTLVNSLGNKEAEDRLCWIRFLNFLRMVNNLTPIEMGILFQQFDAMMLFFDEERQQTMRHFLRTMPTYQDDGEQDA